MAEAPQLANWLITGEGRLVCAALLFIVVWVLKNNEKVKASLLTTPERKRIAVVLLAALPAVATALTTDSALRDIGATFITAVFGAMGIHGALDLQKKKEEAKAEKPEASSEADPQEEEPEIDVDEGEAAPDESEHEEEKK